MGALIAARLIGFVLAELKLPFPVKAFCDSMVVLHWIRNVEKVWKGYVQRRVQEIRKFIPVESWHYVPSAQNPADILTKISSARQFVKSELWWHAEIPPDDTHVEARLEEGESEAADEVCCVSSPIIFPIEIERYSSFDKCVRILQAVFRFVNVSLHRERVSADLVACRSLLIRHTQSTSFVSETNNLLTGTSLPHSSSIYQLNPFLDSDNILRVRTRLENSGLSYDEIYPILIPSDSRIAKMIIRDIHERLLHGGVGAILVELRKQYWIPRARQLVRSVVSSCRKCRRRSCKTVVERWASLPSDRCDSSYFRPFQNSGVDHFGPVRISDGDCYVLLITCLKLRAVHLELCKSQNTSDFMDAFLRFSSRRGIPVSIHSDNSTTFRKAATICQRDYGVRWHFIAERSPHKGGAWERMVQTVKRPLVISLRNTFVDFVSLQTWLCKVEAVVNKRPLTYVSSGILDPLPICPEDFLLARPGLSRIRPISFTSLLNSRDKQLQYFFSRWKDEVLKSERPLGRASIGRGLRVGDVVLVTDGAKREMWPLARIEELFIGGDGRCRSVREVMVDVEVCVCVAKGKVLGVEYKLFIFWSLVGSVRNLRF
jgi:transposase InsO family protein